MPAPYSLDLRKKAIAAVERGERKSDVSRQFELSRNTLDLWLKRHAEQGSPAAKTGYPRGRRPAIDDLEELRAFVAEHGHRTQKEMLKRWPKPISQSAFSRALQRIEFTRKKRAIFIESGTKS